MLGKARHSRLCSARVVKPMTSMPATAGRAFHDHRGTRVAERQRCELLAEQGADLPRRVPAEVGDVLAGNHHAAADLAPGDEVLKDEHPGQHAGARVREIEVRRLRGADRLLDVQAERGLEGLREPALGPGDAGADQHLYVLRLMLRMSQAVAGRPGGQGERVLARSDDVPFVDAGQPLQLDAGAVAGPAHQVPGRQALGGQLHAHALDPASPGTARTGRPECQPVIWLLAVSFGHRTLRALCLPSQNLWSSRCAVGTNVTGGEPSGPMIEGLLIWPGTRTGPTVGS